MKPLFIMVLMLLSIGIVAAACEEDPVRGNADTTVTVQDDGSVTITLDGDELAVFDGTDIITAPRYTLRGCFEDEVVAWNFETNEHSVCVAIDDLIMTDPDSVLELIERNK